MIILIGLNWQVMFPVVSPRKIAYTNKPIIGMYQTKWRAKQVTQNKQ